MNECVFDFFGFFLWVMVMVLLFFGVVFLLFVWQVLGLFLNFEDDLLVIFIMIIIIVVLMLISVKFVVFWVEVCVYNILGIEGVVVWMVDWFKVVGFMVIDVGNLLLFDVVVIMVYYIEVEGEWVIVDVVGWMLGVVVEL